MSCRVNSIHSSFITHHSSFSMDPYSLQSYQFELPQELIAQQPCEPRDASRLMVVDRASGTISERVFRELPDLLNSGDSLVMNNTKVIPCRLLGKREGGGKTEIFLLRPLEGGFWEALAKPGKRLRLGSVVSISDTFSCEIQADLHDGRKVVKLLTDGDAWDQIEQYGQMPLPHYIRRPEAQQNDKQRYQTVYAREKGAVAAPTAGLHFTEPLLRQLSEKQISASEITLHVGLGTFQPVQVDDIRQHKMHMERFIIGEETAQLLNARPKDKRQICVGTTTCRALESVASAEGVIVPGEYETDIYIYPGYRFKYVQSLLTNFHLPGSTLLMLVSAFAGAELMREAYQKAVRDRFRFFSYGDAMLIL